MEINAIDHKHVKVCRSSVTVKGDNGKTIGVVTGCNTYASLQPRQQFDFSKVLRQSGLWANQNIDINKQVVFKDGKIYYLHDLQADYMYQKYFHMVEVSQKRYEARQLLKETAKEFVTVIECYLM